MNKKLLLLRGGYHKEFAFRTIFRKGCELILLDGPTCEQLPLADYPYIINEKRDHQKLYEAAMDIYKQHKYDGIITFYSSTVITIGMLSDTLGFDYYSEETGRILFDKYEARSFLHKIGADHTRFYEVNSFEDMQKAAEIIGYPFIIKPTDNAASRGVIRIYGPDELRAAYDASVKLSFKKRLIAEEIINGNEYCVEVLIHKGEVYPLLITRKYVTEDKYCIEYMDVAPAPIDTELKAKIESYMIETLSQFNIKNWILHVEFRVDENNQPRIIEINPRTAGGALLESVYHLHGIDPYDYYFDIALHNEVDIEKLKAGIKCPAAQYSLFSSLLTPKGSGTIKKIRGIDEARSLMENGRERLVLAYDSGAYLPECTTNMESRGYLYIFGNDHKELVERAKKIEASLVYDLEK